MKKVLRKIIKNGVTYYLPEGGGGGGGDIDTNGVNALIDLKLGNYDSLFQMKSGLYKILNSIDEDDELGLESGETRNDIIANASSMSKISHCYAVMCMIVNSEYAFNKVYNSSIAFKEITECWNSITITAENDDSKNKYLSEEKGVIELLTKEIVQNAFGLGITDILNDSKLFNLISDENFFTYFLENDNNLSLCVNSTNGKTRINNYSADDLLPAIYSYTGDLGYSTFDELAEDDTAMETIENSAQAMLIVNNNEEAVAYFDWRPSSSTVIYAPLNGDTTSYGKYTGSLTLGSDTAWEDITGIVKGLRFKGNTNSYGQFSDVPTMNGDFTVNCWVYFYSYGDEVFIERGQSDDTNRDFHYVMRSSTHKVDMGFYANDCAGNTALQTGKWYNLMGTYNATTKEQKVYINGVLDATRTGSGDPDFGSGPLYIGCKKSYTSNSASNVTMARFILEDRIWTAEEGAEYYEKVSKKLFCEKWSDFQQVEYIQSAGEDTTGQYINTLVEVANGTKLKVETDIYYLGQTSDYGVIFGYYNNGSNLYQLGYIRSSSSFLNNVNGNTSLTVSWEPNSYAVNTRYKVIAEGTTNVASGLCPSLLGQSEGSNPRRRMNAKLYYCKIWKDDILVRDFIPCYRKSDNEIGLFDKVENKFYKNDGSGTFTKGSDIN